MQCWKEGGKGVVGSAAEELLLTTQSNSASRLNSAARPTDTTAIGTTCDVVEGCQRV